MHRERTHKSARPRLQSVAATALLCLFIWLASPSPSYAQKIDLETCLISSLCVVLEVEVPVVEIVEKVVEVPVEVVREVLVPGPERIVEVEVEVPGPERIVEVEVPGPERIVEVEVEVPGPERIVEVETVVTEQVIVTEEGDVVDVIEIEPEGPPDSPPGPVQRVVNEIASLPIWAYILAVLVGAAVGGLLWYYKIYQEREERVDEDLWALREIRKK